MNLSELRNLIRAYTLRDDLTDTLINGFVTLAETKFRASIKHHLMETTVVLPIAAGTNYVTIPADFKEARSIELNGETITLTSIDERDGVGVCKPGYIISGNRIMIVPADVATGDVTLVYFALVPSLTEGAQTNWLIDRFPDVYLHSVLAAAYHFLDNERQMGTESQLLAGAIANVTASHMKAAYSGSTMRMPKGGL